MPGIIRLTPNTSPKAKILFAAQMSQHGRFDRPSQAMMYLAPPLLDQGYEVLISRLK